MVCLTCPQRLYTRSVLITDMSALQAKSSAIIVNFEMYSLCDACCSCCLPLCLANVTILSCHQLTFFLLFSAHIGHLKHLNHVNKTPKLIILGKRAKVIGSKKMKNKHQNKTIAISIIWQVIYALSQELVKYGLWSK